MYTELANMLVNTLEKEAEIYRTILDISNNKTDVIIKGKVAELESMVKVEQFLLLQLGKLEDDREKLVDALAAGLGIMPSEMTISGLTKHLPPEEAEKLKACQTVTVNILNELKHSNDTNSRLIKNSLEYIDFSLNLFSATDGGNNNYGNTGQMKAGKKRNLIDMKL